MTTTNKSLAQPAHGSANWDTPLNSNFAVIDAALGSFTYINVTGIGTAPVVLTNAQYQCMGIVFSGTLSNNVTYKIPSGVGGSWIIANGTTGAFSVTIANTGGGTTINVAQGTRALLGSDGTNIFYTDDSRAVPAGSSGQVQYNSSGAFAGSSNLTFDGNYLSSGSFYASAAFNVIAMGYADTSASISFYNTVGSGGTSETITLNTGGAVRASFDSSGKIFLNGNVGIGTATPGTNLEVVGNVLISNAHSYYGRSSGGAARAIAGIDASNNLVIGDGSLTGTIAFYNNSINSLLLDTTGNACVGVAEQSASGLTNAVAARGYFTRSGYGGSFDNSTFNIQNTGSALIAWVNNVNAGTIVTYSDHRMKSDVSVLPGGALSRVMSMRPVSYRFKDDAGTLREGFIAHELQPLIPSSVQGDPDAMTIDGEVQPQSLTWAPIVAVLTKALQELKQEFDAYKAAHP